MARLRRLNGYSQEIAWFEFVCWLTMYVMCLFNKTGRILSYMHGICWKMKVLSSKNLSVFSLLHWKENKCFKKLQFSVKLTCSMQSHRKSCCDSATATYSFVYSTGQDLGVTSYKSGWGFFPADSGFLVRSRHAVLAGSVPSGKRSASCIGRHAQKPRNLNSTVGWSWVFLIPNPLRLQPFIFGSGSAPQNMAWSKLTQ